MKETKSKRPYRKRKRAEMEEETRRRITEAAVELHGTVGPAQTKVTELAKRAGVSRKTVYNHFPTEADLVAACSAHWTSRNPFPDPSRWVELTDANNRLRSGLSELYEWYGQKRGMLENILRDAPVVESLGALMEESWDGYTADVVSALVDGWPMDDEEKVRLRAAVRVAVDFGTWRTLMDSGLESLAAAELAANMVLAAAPTRS